MNDSYSGLHDPYEDQLASARYRAERDQARQELARLRDEMEAMRPRLMPDGMEWLLEAWPRFEDGRPVRFLDDFERCGDENGVSVVTMYSDGSFALNFRAYSKGERVNRPAPKVPDADGAETRVGDTVWPINGLGPFKVTRILYADQLRVIADDEENGHLNAAPKNLTHRAPGLAADGRPLLKYETVYEIKTGDRYFITNVFDGMTEPDFPEHTVECRKYEDVVTHMFKPSQLTHERPDSWERLEEDCAKSDVDYCAERGLLDPSCDTVEGDGSTRHCTDCGCTCGEKMARDLVRRAKKLAERERGE